jgi:predicted alpha/beta-fold hydrolase
MLRLVAELNVRAVLPTIRVPTLVVQHSDDPFIVPEWGKYVADHISGAKYVEALAAHWGRPMIVMDG